MNIVIFVLAAATVLNTIYIIALRSANDRLWSFVFELSDMYKESLENEKDMLIREQNLLKSINDMFEHNEID